MKRKLITLVVLVGSLSLFCLSPDRAKAQNLITNGDFSAGLQGWTVVPTDPAPWPLVNGAVNLHPPSGNYTGTVIYQDLNITGAGGKTYTFSMKLLKTGMPDGAWRTIAVYFTYLDGGSPVRYKLANPLNSEIATPVSLEGIPTYSGTISVSATLPTTATSITKFEIAKENFGDFTADDIALTEGTGTSPGTNATLTVQLAGTGGGTISGTGLVCGAAGCTGSYPAGTQVTLTAAPDSGSTFTGWGYAKGCSTGLNCTIVVEPVPPETGVVVTAAFIATAPPAGAGLLPKTGQAKCDNEAGTEISCAGTAQDGGVLAGAAWPAPRFADNGNGTVTDHLTGLVWLKDAGCTGFGTFVPWTDALTKANTLAAGQCGLADGSQAGDWRLPNINEIRSLLNMGQADTAAWLNSQGFSNVGSSYWSSTPHAQQGDFVWRVDLQTGMISGLGITPGTRVWPVRGGQSGGAIALPRTGRTVSLAAGDDGALQRGAAWPSPRFTDNGNGSVMDHLSGLIWLKKGNCSLQTKSWNDALAYAAALAPGQCDLADGSQAGDWRLPNAIELQSLIDWSRTGPALPAGHPFLGVEPNYYWTSTSQTQQTGSAWQVNVNTGITTPANKSNGFSNAYAWPVRTHQSAAVSRTLTVAKAGTGSGTVTSASAGIDCGTTCSASFANGSQVTLTATPAAGSTFTGWSGGGLSGTGNCTVTLNSDVAITAAFYPPTAANAGADRVVFDKAVLDAGASQGNIVSYQWTLTHRTNTAYNRMATGPAPTLTDIKPGFYDVTLTVTDAASQARTATSLLAVAGVLDVSGDGKPGLAEVIWLLQVMTGLRP